MSELKDQIKNLLQLQDIDTHRVVIIQEMEEVPARVAELEKMLDTKLGAEEKAESQKTELEDRRKELEDKIKDANRKTRRSQARMNDIKNSRQHQAILKEMEDLKMYREEWEEALMMMVDDIEMVNIALEKAQDGLGELKTNLKKEKSGMGKTVSKMGKEIKKLDKDREEFALALPVHVLDRYEFIRSRLPDTAVAPVIDGTCQVCHMALPPQSFNELRRMEDLMTCPSCNRIIYYAEAMG